MQSLLVVVNTRPLTEGRCDEHGGQSHDYGHSMAGAEVFRFRMKILPQAKFTGPDCDFRLNYGDSKTNSGFLSLTGIHNHQTNDRFVQVNSASHSGGEPNPKVRTSIKNKERQSLSEQIRLSLLSLKYYLEETAVQMGHCGSGGKGAGEIGRTERILSFGLEYCDDAPATMKPEYFSIDTSLTDDCLSKKFKLSRVELEQGTGKNEECDVEPRLNIKIDSQPHAKHATLFSLGAFRTTTHVVDSSCLYESGVSIHQFPPLHPLLQQPLYETLSFKAAAPSKRTCAVTNVPNSSTPGPGRNTGTAVSFLASSPPTTDTQEDTSKRTKPK